MVARLDTSLAHLAEVIRHHLGRDIKEVPGAGAAGGLGRADGLWGHFKTRH